MKEMVMSEETIFGICKRLGEEISKDLQNEEKLPIFVCVMKRSYPIYGRFNETCHHSFHH